jgi:hypothetical protein
VSVPDHIGRTAVETGSRESGNNIDFQYSIDHGRVDHVEVGEV